MPEREAFFLAVLIDIGHEFAFAVKRRQLPFKASVISGL